MLKKFLFVLAAPLMAIALAVVGCSIDDSSDPPAMTATNVTAAASTETNMMTTATEPAPVIQIDVTGTWSISGGGNVIDTWLLQQSGVSVQGSNQEGRRIVGSISGDRFVGDLLPAAGEPTISINAGVSGNTMSGSANSSAGENSFTGQRN